MCGNAHPWATRQARFRELEKVLDQDPAVSEDDKLKVRQELEEIANDPDADPADEQSRWEAVKRRWPGMVAAGGGSSRE